MPDYDFRAVEKKWQKRWRAARIFDAKPGRGNKFFLTWPFPYTTGIQHAGHARTGTVADAIARYHRMRGENVFFPMAWHMTGTPVQSIANRIAAGEAEAIEMYRGYVRVHEKDEKKVDSLLKTFTDPMNVARYFASTFKEDYESMGYSIDWTREFTTGDADFQAFVTWQFLRLQDAGYITTGDYPILYCTRDENAAGEDDIKDGDSINAEVATLTGIKFQFEDGFLIAATFRPETIFGATNLWVNRDADYVECKVGSEKWIVSKRAFEKIKRQYDNVHPLMEMKGGYFAGRRCTNPATGKQLPILHASFVDPSNATGIVYSVPAHAPYDYAALVDSGQPLTQLSIITVPGYGELPAKEACEKLGVKTQNDKELLDKATQEIYKSEFYQGTLKQNCGPFAGRKVSEAKEDVVAWLKGKNAAADVYEVQALATPVKCRCGGDVVVAVMKNQWFIHYTPEWKKKASTALSGMEIYPEHYRKLFENTFAWLDKRPCARKRGIGTPLPFEKGWIIESLSDSTVYMAFYTIKRKLNEYRIRAEQLTPAFFDFVFSGKGTPAQVAKETRIPATRLKAIRDEFLYWYPNDWRHTATGHVSNHLSFFIFHHVALFDKKHWPRAISLNEMVVREGAKMSKSRGNVVPIVDIANTYSTDLYRLYATSSADLDSLVDFREAEVASLRSKLYKFWEACSQKLPAKKREPPVDAWLESRVNRAILESAKALDEVNLRRHAQVAFFDLLNDFDHYRKRGGRNPAVLKPAISAWIRLLAPIVPHMCEELWFRSGGKGFVSIAPWPIADKKKINDEAETLERMVLRLEEDAANVIKLSKIDKPKQITIFTADAWKRRLQHEALKLSPPEVIKKLMQTDEARSRPEQAAKVLQYYAKHHSDLAKPATQEKETEYLQGAAGYLSKKLGTKILIQKASESQHPKTQAALPLKPAILVE